MSSTSFGKRTWHRCFGTFRRGSSERRSVFTDTEHTLLHNAFVICIELDFLVSWIPFERWPYFLFFFFSKNPCCHLRKGESSGFDKWQDRRLFSFERKGVAAMVKKIIKILSQWAFSKEWQSRWKTVMIKDKISLHRGLSIRNDSLRQVGNAFLFLYCDFRIPISFWLVWKCVRIWIGCIEFVFRCYKKKKESKKDICISRAVISC